MVGENKNPQKQERKIQKNDKQLLYGQSSTCCCEKICPACHTQTWKSRLNVSSQSNAQCITLNGFFIRLIKWEPDVFEAGSHNLLRRVVLNSQFLWYSWGDLTAASPWDRMSYLSYKDSTTLSRKLFYLFLVQLIFFCLNSWNYLPKGQTTTIASTWEEMGVVGRGGMEWRW